MKKKFLFLALLSFLLLLGLIFFEIINKKCRSFLFQDDSIEKKIVDNPDDPLLNYRTGKAKYLKKKFNKAKGFFKKAGEEFPSNNAKMKGLSYAFAGNCGLRVAQILIDKKQKRKEAKAKAIEILTDTISDYSKSLSIVPENQRVLANMEVAQALLRNLQKPHSEEESGNNNENNDQNNPESNSSGGESGDDPNKRGDGSLQDRQKNNSKNKESHNKRDSIPESDQQGGSRDESEKTKDNVKNDRFDEQNEQNSKNDLGNGETVDEKGQDKSQKNDLNNSDNERQGAGVGEKQLYGGETADKLGDKDNSDPVKDGQREQEIGQQEGEDALLEEIDQALEEEGNQHSLQEGDKQEDKENQDKKKAMLAKIAKRRSEADFNMLDESEGALRKQIIMRATARGAKFGQKGW